MKKKLAIIVLVTGVIGAGWMWKGHLRETVEIYTESGEMPRIRPAYSGLVIPVNIAPLNFQILESGQVFVVKIQAGQSKPIEIYSKTGHIQIPPRLWRSLLEASKGQALVLDVFAKDTERQWTKFQSLTHTIANEVIDDTLVYRRMKPIYNHWNDIGIYQRSLVTCKESVVLHGRSFGHGCPNCHSFVGHDPDTMTIGLRSATYGSATLLAHQGAVDKIGTRWGYTAWHPSGKLAVYSLNKVRQFFHHAGLEVRDVVDLDSALACYQTQTRKVVCPPELAQKDRLETYPAWSPDGKYLYFCSAPLIWADRDTIPPANYDQLQYDLCRIPYHVDTDTWGAAETVLAAQETGQSILLPRISPDGRFLLFCMCQYGCFPVYQPSSDLYLMELTTQAYHKLDINSDYSESWHCWSSNSRWIAFSSKRQGGLFTRTFLSYVDDTGKAHKPFLVPQHDPTFYDSLLETYSVPELVKGRIHTSRPLLARASRLAASIDVQIPITGATPQATPKAAHPWQERE